MNDEHPWSRIIASTSMAAACAPPFVSPPIRVAENYSSKDCYGSKADQGFIAQLILSSFTHPRLIDLWTELRCHESLTMNSWGLYIFPGPETLRFAQGLALGSCPNSIRCLVRDSMSCCTGVAKWIHHERIMMVNGSWSWFMSLLERG